MKRVSVYDLAERASMLLPFTNGNIGMAIDATLNQFRDYIVIRDGIDKWTVDNDGNNDEFLRHEIVHVPEAREKFAEALCESIMANRSEHSEIPGLVQEWTALNARLKEIESIIFDIDSKASDLTDDIEDLIDWSVQDVTPGVFTRGSELERIDPTEAVRRRRIERQWSSNIYFGPDTFRIKGLSLHNISLHFDVEWSVWHIETSDGISFSGDTVKEATREFCDYFGIRPIRTYRDLRTLWRDKSYEFNPIEFEFLKVIGDKQWHITLANT